MTERDRVYRTEAVILKRMDFGEADRVLTIYTPELGKLRVVGKGVRKSLSRKSGHVELFVRSRLLVARGRNMDLVTQAETMEPFLPLRRDLFRVSYACYVAELLDAFTPDEEGNPQLYELLVNALQWICETDDLDRAMRFYELRLLENAGFRPQLFSCALCNESIRPVRNFFGPERGGVLCPLCGPKDGRAEEISLNALKVLRYFQTRDYPTCAQVHVSAGVQREVERIMQHYIVYHLERRLKSTEFLALIRRQETAAV